MSDTIQLTYFTEAVDFDFINGGNWSPYYPGIFDPPYAGDPELVEADITLAPLVAPGVSYLAGYSVEVPAGQDGSSAGLIIGVPWAAVDVAGFLDTSYAPIQNYGGLSVDLGGVLQASTIENLGIYTFNAGIDGTPTPDMVNFGKIVLFANYSDEFYQAGPVRPTSGLIQGGTLINFGLLSNYTTLDGVLFAGTLDLTQSDNGDIGYNNVGLTNTSFESYAGTIATILLTGPSGDLYSAGDETLDNVLIEFGSGNVSLSAFDNGTPSTLTIGSSVTFDFTGTDPNFYVNSIDTMVNQTTIDLNVSGGVGIFTGQGAGTFENSGSLTFENGNGGTLYAVNFLNESGGLLEVRSATLDDMQFGEQFVNAGLLQIGKGGNFTGVEQGFTNTVNGVIDLTNGGQLNLLGIDIDGEIVAATPTTFENDGLIELDGTGSAYLNLDMYTPIHDTPAVLVNNGTIALSVGVMDLNAGVTVDGGTLTSTNGTVAADGGVLENVSLQGDFVFGTLAGLPGSFGDLWFEGDVTFAPNTAINVTKEGVTLDFAVSDVVSNLALTLGAPGTNRVNLVLETQDLQFDSSTSLTVDAEAVYISTGTDMPSGTLYSAGDFLAAVDGGILNIDVTSFENAGKFALSNGQYAGVFGSNGTNDIGALITIGANSTLTLGDQFDSLNFVNEGSMSVASGGTLMGYVTLTAGDPLSIAAGGVFAGASISNGTMAANGAIAMGGLDGPYGTPADVFSDILYQGSLTIAGALYLESAATFVAASGPGPDTLTITAANADLSYQYSGTLDNVVVDLGATAVSGTPVITSDSGTLTLGPLAVIDLVNTYATLDSDPGADGSIDNQGSIGANFLNGRLAITGLANFTNDGIITVGDDADVTFASPFTENADGNFTVVAGSALTVQDGITLASGGVVTLDPGSVLNLGGTVSGGTIVANGVTFNDNGTFSGVTIDGNGLTITGTATFSDVTFVGSPTIIGELQLDSGNTFLPASVGGPPPVINLILSNDTLDIATSQTLNNVQIDIGSPFALAPATVQAGSATSDAAVTLGSNVLIDETSGYFNGSAELSGSSDDASSIDNLGTILARQPSSTFTITSLADFTNDGSMTVSNGSNLVVDAPFTENADGSFEIAANSSLTVQSTLTVASGTAVTLDPFTQLFMSGGLVQGVGGTSTINGDEVTLQGTGEFAGINYFGSPTVDGDLELGSAVTFQAPASNPAEVPTITLNSNDSTLDVLTSQTLTGINITIGSPDAAEPATFAAGLGDTDAAVDLGNNVTVLQNDSYVEMSGSSDGASSIENDGQIDAETAGGVFTIASLAGFTNTGDIEVQNGDELIVGPTILNNGTVDDQSVVNFDGAVNGDGTILLSSSGVLAFAGPVAATQQILLNDGLITLDDPADFAGNITNFGADDVLYMPNETGSNAFYNGSQLSFTDGNGNTVTLNISGNLPYGSQPSSSDGNNGFVIGAGRTLVWTGATDNNFANALDWNDTTDGIDPASEAPNPADTTQFINSGGSITGISVVGSLVFGGGNGWTLNSANLTALNGVTVGGPNGGFLTLSGDSSIISQGTQDVISGDSGNSASVAVEGKGSTWTSDGELTVGQQGAYGALIVQSQGTVSSGAGAVASAGGGLVVADTGGSGSVAVSGAGAELVNTGQFIVGNSGFASLLISSGGAVQTSGGAVDVAAGAGSDGSNVSVNGTGSTWQVSGPLVVGNAAAGSLAITAGGTVSAAQMDTGALAGGSGIVSVIGMGSTLTLTGQLTIGDAASAELSILSGGTVNANNADIGLNANGTGNVDIEGTGSELNITNNLNIGDAGVGVVTLGNNTTLAVGNNINVGANGILNQLGGSIDPSTITIAPSGRQGGHGSTTASVEISNAGTLYASSGTETVNTPLITAPSGKTGILEIDTNGDLVLNVTSVDATQSVNFTDGTGILTLGTIGGFGGTIATVNPGDQIIVQGTSIAADSYNATNDVLTLFNGTAGTIGTLKLAASVDGFALLPNGSGGITAAPCFVAGTRISTERGEVAVEDLREGDRVQVVRIAAATPPPNPLPQGEGELCTGRYSPSPCGRGLGEGVAAQPVVWIGHRTIDCSRHPKPHQVWPVRIAAGAFGTNRPCCDLFLSPDHAVFIDSVLIPVKHLINGATITQVQCDAVTYFHVELAEHSVLLAEGLPAESYLDTGDRGNFANADGPIALYPDFACRIWDADGCAPLVVTGPELEAARSWVNTVALSLPQAPRRTALAG
jgi:collagen type I alpha